MPRNRNVTVMRSGGATSAACRAQADAAISRFAESKSTPSDFYTVNEEETAEIMNAFEAHGTIDAAGTGTSFIKDRKHFSPTMEAMIDAAFASFNDDKTSSKNVEARLIKPDKSAVIGAQASTDTINMIRSATAFMNVKTRYIFVIPYDKDVEATRKDEGDVVGTEAADVIVAQIAAGGDDSVAAKRAAAPPTDAKNARLTREVINIRPVHLPPGIVPNSDAASAVSKPFLLTGNSILRVNGNGVQGLVQEIDTESSFEMPSAPGRRPMIIRKNPSRRAVVVFDVLRSAKETASTVETMMKKFTDSGESMVDKVKEVLGKDVDLDDISTNV